MPRPGRTGALILVLVQCGAVSCGARLRPLAGAPAPAVLPAATLPGGHQHVVFRWTLDDPDFVGRGEGAARLAYPDTVRVDFFLAGGMGSGAVILIRDDMRFPEHADPLSRRLAPPAPLLWAALGRAAVPPARDTSARVDGDTLRADIGMPAAWRLTFARDSLRRLERIRGRRIVEWVARLADGRVRYRNEISRRQLDLTVIRSEHTGAFDAAIWKLP